MPEEYRSLTPDPDFNYKLTFNFCTNPEAPFEDCTTSIYSMGYLYTLYLKALDDPTNKYAISYPVR